jgi:hypothetical protein
VRCSVKGQGITVELRLDNQSAVSYINRGECSLIPIVLHSH